jgi:hypothetical protein
VKSDQVEPEVPSDPENGGRAPVSGATDPTARVELPGGVLEIRVLARGGQVLWNGAAVRLGRRSGACAKVLLGVAKRPDERVSWGTLARRLGVEAATVVRTATLLCDALREAGSDAPQIEVLWGEGCRLVAHRPLRQVTSLEALEAAVLMIALPAWRGWPAGRLVVDGEGCRASWNDRLLPLARRASGRVLWALARELGDCLPRSHVVRRTGVAAEDLTNCLADLRTVFATHCGRALEVGTIRGRGVLLVGADGRPAEVTHAHRRP